MAQRGAGAGYLVSAGLAHDLHLLVSEAHQRLIRSGLPDVVPMPAGQIVGRITEVRPVAEVMAELIEETGQTLNRLHGLQ